MAKSRHANAKTESSSPAEHRKNLIRLLNANSHRHHLWDVFADFCEMGALAISNSVDLAQRNEREKRYMSVIKKYEPSEVHRFPQMLAELTMAMEYGPDDVLGWARYSANWSWGTAQEDSFSPLTQSASSWPHNSLGMVQICASD